MKLYVVAVCVMAAVSADISHLNGHGYNYDKPAVAFNFPRQTPVNTQHQLPRPSNTYLPPAQPQYAASPSALVDTYSPSSGPANEYAAPQPQYLGSPSAQVDTNQQYDISQASSTSQQQFFAPPQVPANEYLSPQRPTFGPTSAPRYQQEESRSISFSQPQNAAPTPAYHSSISQSFSANQQQYNIPIYNIDPLPISTPASDYLPPQRQQAQHQQPFKHQREDDDQPLTAPAGEYLPPRQQQQQQQQHHTTPFQGKKYAGRNQDAPVRTPAHNYLPPTRSAPANEYLPPPSQQQQQKQQQHHQYQQQHHQYNQYDRDTQGQVQNDGYHYKVPGERFRFRF